MTLEQLFEKYPSLNNYSVHYEVQKAFVEACVNNDTEAMKLMMYSKELPKNASPYGYDGEAFIMACFHSSFDAIKLIWNYETEDENREHIMRASHHRAISYLIKQNAVDILEYLYQSHDEDTLNINFNKAGFSVVLEASLSKGYDALNFIFYKGNYHVTQAMIDFFGDHGENKKIVQILQEKVLFQERKREAEKLEVSLPNQNLKTTKNKL